MDETSESGGNLSTLSSLSEVKNESNYSTANKTVKKKKQKMTDEANFGPGGSVCLTLSEKKGRRDRRAKPKSKREEVGETDQYDAVPQRRKRKKKVPTSESLSPSSSTYEIEYQLHSPKPSAGYVGVDVDVDIESLDEEPKPKVWTKRIGQRGRRHSEDDIHPRKKTPQAHRKKPKKTEPASETSSTRNLPRKSSSAGEARPVPVRSSPRSRRKLKFSSSSANVDRSVRRYCT